MKTIGFLAVFVLALFSSPKADAAQFVHRYDGQTNLYSRILDGSVDADLRRVHTGTDPETRQPRFFEFPYRANVRALEKYAQAFACASRLDVSACIVRKSKETK